VGLAVVGDDVSVVALDAAVAGVVVLDTAFDGVVVLDTAVAGAVVPFGYAVVGIAVVRVVVASVRTDVVPVVQVLDAVVAIASDVDALVVSAAAVVAVLAVDIEVDAVVLYAVPLAVDLTPPSHQPSTLCTPTSAPNQPQAQISIGTPAYCPDVSNNRTAVQITPSITPQLGNDSGEKGGNYMYVCVFK
jgi:hypothetical protein